MIATAVDILDCPVAEGTLLQVREPGIVPRTFIIRNLTANTPSFKIQASVDGTTWTDQTLSDGTMQITLGAAGGGTDMSAQRITTSNQLRIRGSGGGADLDLEVALLRAYVDSNKIWGSPLL